MKEMGEKEEMRAASDEWWLKRRINFNIGLVISGVTAFMAYVFVGANFYDSPEREFETTIFSIFFQGIGYVIMMLIANVLYLLGPVVDQKFNKEDSEQFRRNLYSLGFWFSFALPFSIPIMLLIVSFTS